MLLLNFRENKSIELIINLFFEIKCVLNFKKRNIWTSEPRNDFQSIPFEKFSLPIIH